ncbi:MAG: hypothetical protein K0Q83_3170 [Deltaproteobacteria bacterium]|nr:hypothetical protein [Deltaproteobacteria bacterium]
MAINKTAAGTYRVDFRDQHGRRLRKRSTGLKTRAISISKSIGDISKGDFVAQPILPSRISPNPGTSERTTLAHIGMVRFTTGESTLTSISCQPSAH